MSWLDGTLIVWRMMNHAPKWNIEHEQDIFLRLVKLYVASTSILVGGEAHKSLESCGWQESRSYCLLVGSNVSRKFESCEMDTNKAKQKGKKSE